MTGKKVLLGNDLENDMICYIPVEHCGIINSEEERWEVRIALQMIELGGNAKGKR